MASRLKRFCGFAGKRVNRRFILPVFLLFAFAFGYYPIAAQPDGAAIFKEKCTVCHKPTADRLVGPGLANVHKRRSEEWFVKFVTSSQAMIKSGDAEAVAIFEEFNKILMPDPDLSEDQIKAVYKYLIAMSPATEDALAEAPVEAPTADLPVREVTKDDIAAGRDLFVGTKRFENTGPTCNSCHHVTDDQVITAGALAKDLTAAHTRLGDAGIKAILASPPFPAMTQAYTNHALTEEEVFLLAAFLESVASQQIYQHPRDYAKRFLYTGVIGGLLMVGVFSGLWIRRKSNSVNKRIYDRQTRSSN